ncbi:hypothetical protein Lesp02_02690 [Lentzea sp. NBRC 105346]|uniref:hypothetical protein n=1 Tax=Lentzea sp. NBRC 105346 TaxID=3032205 RepID=UPI0024A2EA57|nr:hypothetical protein [Lentzea sp. NBRC 105346]GLZ28079.1 hypothetical protein Lesp02_02690 [Lentzea sp. NBRC 105346]
MTRDPRAPKEDPRLARIRGDHEKRRPGARQIAGLLDNPGCVRRQVVELSRTDPRELSRKAGVPPKFGQSPFAISTGNRIEELAKRGSNYDKLLAVLRAECDLPVSASRIEDLNDIGVSGMDADTRLRLRVRRTEHLLQAIVERRPDAPTIIDHPVLTLSVAGVTVYLEPDALVALVIEDRLLLLEIKSFPVVDGQADTDKTTDAARQLAVYVLAARELIARLGGDPGMVSDGPLLVTPRNTSLSDLTANPIPVRRLVAHLSRALRRVEKVDEILASLPVGFTLDPVTDAHNSGADATQATAAALMRIDANYLPECRSRCDLGEFCHRQHRDQQSPAVLGRSARDTLAGVPTFTAAVRIANSAARPDDTAGPGVADALRRAADAERAATDLINRRRA